MKADENICPVCKESNELEAVVCGHCGAALEDPFMDPGGRTKITNISPELLEGTRDWSVDKTAVPEKGIALYIEGEFKPIHLDSGAEFFVGRKRGSTSEVVDNLLDLSPMGGYGQGISRRHALIRRTEKGYEILDLDSVNGTWVNDVKLAANRPYPLESGSHLRLGRLRLFVLYHPPTETNRRL